MLGQWRGLGLHQGQGARKRPTDGRLQLSIKNFTGLMEIDGVTVRPVSDRQNDSLTSFLEGTEKP